MPGQKPALVTSWEYASRATSSGRLVTLPGCGGAVLPEKRDVARSKLPQKKWTGLALPLNPARNVPSTWLVRRSARHSAVAWAGS